MSKKMLLASVVMAASLANVGYVTGMEKNEKEVWEKKITEELKLFKLTDEVGNAYIGATNFTVEHEEGRKTLHAFGCFVERECTKEGFQKIAIELGYIPLQLEEVFFKVSKLSLIRSTIE
jgi:hypothetical protein